MKTLTLTLCGATLLTFASLSKTGAGETDPAFNQFIQQIKAIYTRHPGQALSETESAEVFRAKFRLSFTDRLAKSKKERAGSTGWAGTQSAINPSSNRLHFPALLSLMRGSSASIHSGMLLRFAARGRRSGSEI